MTRASGIIPADFLYEL